MNGTKLSTLQKNRTEWELQQQKFQPMTYALAPGSNPWKETEMSMKKHMSEPLAHTYGMTKKERHLICVIGLICG